ncbi:MAG: exopolyphosphatase [Deltaproteobacteria bacterium]|nr:exopolyphosphatase [Deltaproteobacteria bacterium]
MARYASIDIGTNTLRLLIASVDDAGGVRHEIYKRRITRLGGDYTDSVGIAPASAERAFVALAEFQLVIAEAGVDGVYAFATSVVRRACNRAWFVDEVEKRTGIRIAVISGDEEARLALTGVLSVIDARRGRDLVIDIGGGSTEFIFTEMGALKGAWSMEMGVVHLAEAHLKSDPPTKGQSEGLEAEIMSVISGLKSRLADAGIDAADYSAASGAAFVGTAGTITTLAALDMNLEVYDRERINGYRLSRTSVERMYERLLSLTLSERGRILSLEKGREDLIIPGTAITLKTMEAFGFDDILVSDAGLLEGIIIDSRLGGRLS